jgi:hypothetical protein
MSGERRSVGASAGVPRDEFAAVERDIAIEAIDGLVVARQRRHHRDRAPDPGA